MATRLKKLRRAIQLFALLVTIPLGLNAQITITPDLPAICVNSSVTLNYVGGWGGLSFWITPGGTPAFSTSQTFSVTYNSAGPKLITVFALDDSPPTIDIEVINVAAQPTSPTLNTQVPAGSPCEGELVSATFNPGSGGIDCTDEFQFSTRVGASWFGPFPYTAGQQLPTGGLDEIIIEGRRSGCNPLAGCNASMWTTLAQWTITNDAVPPVITTCATDKFYNAGPTCQVTVPDLTPEVVATDNCDPAPVVTQSPVAGSVIGEGVTTVTLTVTDAGSNTASCTADITVTDITDPVISGCPADINTTADTSYCSTNVTWTPPTATDNCPGVILTSSHNPGDFFPVGTTAVTYTATDGSGNNDICTFDVNVQPAPDPVINGPDPVCTPSLESYSVNDPGSHTFLWTVTNGVISGSDTNSTVDVVWTGTVQGTVSVIITSGSGCSVSNSITVDKNATSVTGAINSSNSLTRR